MTRAHQPPRLFLWLDRAFWLLWPGLALLAWAEAREVIEAPVRLAAMAPDQAACLAGLPQIVTFSPQGQAVFWAGFGVEFALYAALLALAHRVVRRCAQGRAFVEGMVTALRRIGLVIAAFPLVDLAVSNASLAAWVATGDLAAAAPTFLLEVPVLAVGLLIVTLAAALREAVALQRDADLTI